MHHSHWITSSLVLLGFAACGEGGASKPSAATATTAGADALVGQTAFDRLSADAGGGRRPRSTAVSFELTFPVGFGLSSVTLGSSHSMEISDWAQVQNVDGSPGTSTNTGPDGEECHRRAHSKLDPRHRDAPVEVGSDAKVGLIASVGSIQLHDRDAASALKSGGSVHLGKNDSVGAVTQNATLTPLVHRAFNFSVPAGRLPDVKVGVKLAKAIAPGAYRAVEVERDAMLTLSAGEYVFDSLDLDERATLKLDTSGGLVRVYVRERAEWAGAVSGDGTKFVFAYLGGEPLRLNPGFTGTALAPNALLDLGPAHGDPRSAHASYQGVFYGKDVLVGPRVTVRRIPTAVLVGGLTVSNTDLCVGQQAEVSMTTAADAQGPMTTWIQGTAGAHQFVDFAGFPGPRWVYASVFTPDGRADSTRVQVNVQTCAAAPVPRIGLHFGPALGKPNVVELMVHAFDANGFETLPTGPATYTWSFGDGQTATTHSPLVAHDYTTAVNPLAQFSYFNASVTVTSDAGIAQAQKVVSIWSLYASNRAKGVIQPPNKISISPSALTLTVTNYEPNPISISQAKIDLIPCDPAFAAWHLPPQALAVVIPASSTGTVDVAPPGPFGKNVCAVGVHLIGSAQGGTVYSDGYGRLTKENPLLRQAVTDPDTIALLNQASTQTADPNNISYEELRQLYAQRAIARLPAAISPGNAYSSPGDECTPGDTQAGLVCQPAPDWVANPPEFLNAFKGDFIMDHGCGSIGKLLSAVGQSFSHTEMVSKNRVEVRHSTMSADRLSDSVNYYHMELDPDTLMFGFPGTAGASVYSADQIAHQYCIADPYGSGGSKSERNCDDQGHCDCPEGSWRMGGELNPYPGKCDTDITAVSPIVVRPDPSGPQPDLTGVVNAGLAINSHYRFFMYSHSDTIRPGGTGWSANTESTVCSSFEREAAARAGMPLWSSRSGPEGVPDGMRRYSPEVRKAGGEQLYSNMYDSVMGEAGWLGSIVGTVLPLPGFVETLAGNISTQVANCFAADVCINLPLIDLPVSWENPGEGIAVSPDDIAHWDLGGTYGYDEPLVYLEVSFRHRYRWAAAGNDGSMTVSVVDDKGNPLPGATIVLNDNELVGTTASDGNLSIPNLPQGAYNVGAQYYDQATGGVLPIPPPPVLDSNDKIIALPSCPKGIYCQVQPDAPCPGGYSEYDEDPQPCTESVGGLRHHAESALLVGWGERLERRHPGLENRVRLQGEPDASGPVVQLLAREQGDRGDSRAGGQGEAHPLPGCDVRREHRERPRSVRAILRRGSRLRQQPDLPG